MLNLETVAQSNLISIVENVILAKKDMGIVVKILKFLV